MSAAPGTEALAHLLPGTDPAQPFALIHRPERGDDIEVLTGPMTAVDGLDEIDLDGDPCDTPSGPDKLVLLPYRQITERGFACPDDGRRLLVMRIRAHRSVPRSQALAVLPDEVPPLEDAAFDLDDPSYADLVRRVLGEEIAEGAGANFVLARSFRGRFAEFTAVHALAAFRRLVAAESGAYWTFLVHTGDGYLLGSTPEQHVRVDGDAMAMNPISGTHRYGDADAAAAEDGLLSFLDDTKEADELYMVVDEELKMMAALCDDAVTVDGPALRCMSRVAHTEYVLQGRSRRPLTDILRGTLHAPTVTGSPLVNACRVIERHEPGGRGFYSGVIGLAGRDDRGHRQLDSAILIRTAEITRAGELRLAAGSTIVRDSDPYDEARETSAKVSGLLGPLTAAPTGDRPTATPAPRHTPDPRVRARVQAALDARNDGMSDFWLRRRAPDAGSAHTVTIVDAEDAFTAMLAYQLRAVGCDVSVVGWDDAARLTSPALPGPDVVVFGPGPGDPNDRTDLRICALRAQARAMLARGRPVAGVCLGHQILCDALGLPVRRLPHPHQGRRRRVDLDGRRRSVGYYNSFVAHSSAPVLTRPDGRTVAVDRSVGGEVVALRGEGVSTRQFHPESFLTEDGPDLLREMVQEAVARPVDGGEVHRVHA